MGVSGQTPKLVEMMLLLLGLICVSRGLEVDSRADWRFLGMWLCIMCGSSLL